MGLSEGILDDDHSMELNSLPVRCPPSALDNEHPQASLIGRHGHEAMDCTKEHSAIPPIPVFGNLKMRTSEACCRNFVIFDHCDGQNTVILHPSWLHRLPNNHSSDSGSMKEANGFLDGLQVFNNKSIEDTFGFHVPAAVSPASMEPALQVQQKLSCMPKHSLVDLMSYGTHTVEKRVLGTNVHLDMEQEMLGEFHENTEEINALLTSDNELSSTGHSPSDASSNCHSGAMIGRCTSIPGRKRKLEEDTAVDEADDADSGSGALALGSSCRRSRILGSSRFLQFPCESDHNNAGPGNRSCKQKSSSLVHGPEPLSTSNSGGHGSKQSSEVIGEGRLMDSSKRTKIKSNMQQLKNVIPGGQLLDTAGVLDQTIQYVRCLRNRLRGSEAAGEPVSAMQQIG